MLRAYYSKRGIEPAYEIFRSRGFSPNWTIEESGGNVSMESLSPFLRTLLVTDGTVTKSLEAYYWEQIAVDTVSQELVRAEDSIDWLGVHAGDEVIARRVDLRGTSSGTIYTRAFSLIRPQLIPEPLRSGLIAGSLGIGELIRDCGLETYRELLEIGVTGSVHGDTGISVPAEDYVYRTYRIVLGGQPAILITEHFPMSVFQ